MIGASDFGVCNTLGDGMAAFIAASIAFDATEGVSIDDFEVKSTKRKEKWIKSNQLCHVYQKNLKIAHYNQCKCKSRSTNPIWK